jgi:Leucine-rich repeat (LRR) protein
MSFVSNNYSLTMLMGMGFWALSERLKNEEGPIARIAHVASFALSTGLVLYSARQMYNNAMRPYSTQQTHHTSISPTYNTPTRQAPSRSITRPFTITLPFLRSYSSASTLLNLSNKRLTAPPDLSHTPALRELNLSRNLLTVPPDLSHTPALTKLYLMFNELTTLPDLSHTPALTELYLQDNQLTTPLDLSHTPALLDLDLHDNRLTASPNLSHTPALIFLDLGRNQLTTPPDLSHTPALRILNLEYSQLTASPDLSHTPALRKLNLSHNRLIAPPDLSHTPALNSLDLRNNQLTALHDSILHLPRHGVVHAEENRFSAEYIAAFQRRIYEHRLQYPDQGPTVHLSIADDNLPTDTQTLEQRLRGWSDEYEKIHPPIFGDSRPQITDTNAQTYFEPLLSLGEEDKNNLSNYLRRLRETKDYRNGTPDSKKNVILRVERMIRLACENAEFKGKMLALINEGLTTCGDRVLITFNDIEIQWHIHQTQSESELRNLLVRVERYEQLRKLAIQVAEQSQLGDQVETILHYQIALTKPLNLPISTKGMLYQAMSGVSQTMLDDARTKIASLSDEDLISQSEHWRVYLTKKHADVILKIDEKFNNLLEVAGEYYDIYGIDDNEISSQRRSFLKTHPDLAQLLKDAAGINNFLGISNFINRQRDAAITALGSGSADTLYIDQKERKERKRKVQKGE